MASDRLSAVLASIADVGDEVVSPIDRVCVAAASLLALSGAGISLMVGGELRGSAGVSEPGVAAVQELQLELGQGPCVDAWAEGIPVLESDLADPDQLRWPAFAERGVAAGLRAVFAFPMRLGAIRLGVIVLYRDRPGALTEEELARGLVLADVATNMVLALAAGAPPDTVPARLAGEPPHWAEVHQATGMISVQLAIPMDEAFVRLRGHAFAAEQPLRAVAAQVIARRLRLDSSS